MSITYEKVQDSGTREAFETGSVRDTRAGKGRYDLITPIGLRRLARHYEAGAKKYGERNWEKGQPVSRYLDSAIRHVYTYVAGQRDEDHLAAAIWNLMAAVHTEEQCAAGKLPACLADTDGPADAQPSTVQGLADIYIPFSERLAARVAKGD